MIRFHGSHRAFIEKHYDLDIVTSDDDSYYKALTYIEANEHEYERLLLHGDKCECITPRHVREYIKDKVEAIAKIYNL